MIAIQYMSIYFIGCIIWCDFSESTLLGWLFTVKSAEKHSYLYGQAIWGSVYFISIVVGIIVERLRNAPESKPTT